MVRWHSRLASTSDQKLGLKPARLANGRRALSQLDHEVKGVVLLDSGATHALRPARDQQEWQEAQPTQVTLADGITDKLRLKQASKVLLSAPCDDEWGQSWIIPLGGIAELGYKFEWKNAR